MPHGTTTCIKLKPPLLEDREPSIYISLINHPMAHHCPVKFQHSFLLLIKRRAFPRKISPAPAEILSFQINLTLNTQQNYCQIHLLHLLRFLISKSERGIKGGGTTNATICSLKDTAKKAATKLTNIWRSIIVIHLLVFGDPFQISFHLRTHTQS